MAQSKENFIKERLMLMNINNDYIQAMTCIIPLISKYDGKKITKEIINEINDFLLDENTHVRISLDFFSPFYTKFTLEHVSTYGDADARYYLPLSPNYLTTALILNLENLKVVFENTSNSLKECNKEHESLINKTDTVISLYKDLEEYIHIHMDKIPKCLRDERDTYLKCPIY